MMPTSHQSGSRPTVDDLPMPHQFFLLSLQAEKGRLDDDSEPVRGSLLSAAALAELCIAGLVHSRDGKAERTNAGTPTALDPFLAEVLGDVPPRRPRSWFEVLESRWNRAEGAVRDQLVEAGHIAIEHRQILGPIRRTRIVATDPPQVEALRERVRDAVRAGSEPASGHQAAVLATLAVDGLVGTMFRWRDRRTHKHAIRALAGRMDQEMPGLRKGLTYSIAARRGG
ncbi:GPP34 family phosphoprotein [Micromonospora sp. NPDC005553]|uniref:GOLPH3/VPS74 family protein n=1 Tax=Micromonospora sp. NPDC005553 TaxID=3364232 RepID=UPI0036C72237